MYRRAMTGLLLLGAGVMLSACGSHPTLGVLLPTSGAAADYGKSMKQAIELAIDEAKGAGETPAGLTVVWADSETDPDRAARLTDKLARDDNCHLIIAGVTSAEAKAMLPVLEKTQTVCLSPSASAPSLTKDSRLFYRLFPSDEAEGATAARFLKDDLARDSVLIYSADSEHSRGLEPEFRQVYEQVLGGEVVGRIVLTDPDWSEESADVLAATYPDAVFIVAYADETLEVLRHLELQRFKGTRMVTSAFYNAKAIQENPKLVDGVFFPQPAFDLDSDRKQIQRFVEGYRDRYDTDPDIYSAHGYDALHLAFEVFRKTDRLEVGEIRSTLQFGLEDLMGVTGPIQFDERGDIHHNPIMYLIKDGRVYSHQQYVDKMLQELKESLRRGSR